MRELCDRLRDAEREKLGALYFDVFRQSDSIKKTLREVRGEVASTEGLVRTTLLGGSNLYRKGVDVVAKGSGAGVKVSKAGVYASYLMARHLCLTFDTDRWVEWLYSRYETEFKELGIDGPKALATAL